MFMSSGGKVMTRSLTAGGAANHSSSKVCPLCSRLQLALLLPERHDRFHPTAFLGGVVAHIPVWANEPLVSSVPSLLIEVFFDGRGGRRTRWGMQSVVRGKPAASSAVRTVRLPTAWRCVVFVVSRPNLFSLEAPKLAGQQLVNALARLVRPHGPTKARGKTCAPAREFGRLALSLRKDSR